MNIYDDFVKVKKHLGLPGELPLLVDPSSAEGFYFSRQDIVQLPMGAVKVGIKEGYDRRMLVHECLHAKGYEHYTPSRFESNLQLDTYSAGIEKEIFGMKHEASENPELTQTLDIRHPDFKCEISCKHCYRGQSGECGCPNDAPLCSAFVHPRTVSQVRNESKSSLLHINPFQVSLARFDLNTPIHHLNDVIRTLENYRSWLENKAK
jgi:hypothetical protein